MHFWLFRLLCLPVLQKKRDGRAAKSHKGKALKPGCNFSLFLVFWIIIGYRLNDDTCRTAVGQAGRKKSDNFILFVDINEGSFPALEGLRSVIIELNGFGKYRFFGHKGIG
jgi:hypothetical protein